MTTHADLALAKRNITPTRSQLSKKYTNFTAVNQKIFDLPPSIKYLEDIYIKLADTRLVDKLY